MLWALQKQYPLSCWQPSHQAMGCHVPKRLCRIVVKLELCSWGDAGTTKGAANFHISFSISRELSSEEAARKWQGQVLPWGRCPRMG